MMYRFAWVKEDDVEKLNKYLLDDTWQYVTVCPITFGSVGGSFGVTVGHTDSTVYHVFKKPASGKYALDENGRLKFIDAGNEAPIKAVINA